MPRVLISAISAATLLMFLGPKFIAWLRANEVGQFVRAPGLIPAGHAEKQGTPTMGGLLILVATTLPFIILSSRSTEAMLVLFTTLACGAIGFIDDFMKVVKKRSLGLSGRWRMFGLLLVSIVLVWASVDVVGLPTALTVPLLDESFEIGIAAFFVVIFLVVAGAANAVNLTDGLDGLAPGCTIMAAAAFAVLSYVVGNVVFSNYLFIQFVPGAGELSVFCAALAGATLGFLWFNCHPAEIFMGDTGALPLGGAIGFVAVCIKQELLLVVIGGIFVVEAASVIIQVLNYKFTKRRVFRIAPLHHHFQYKGWAESKVTIRFWIIAAILAAFGLATLKLR